MSIHKTHWYYIFLLILAGESIFILPFVLPRVFRPTVLESFDLSNLELGFCFSTYGIIALFSYLIGGPIADKYPPRKLIAISLWMTALGGFLLANFPSLPSLKILYGYWGFSTIFLFWAPMIKATRIWGGDQAQGKAFGFLDGGRGLVGALFGSMGVLIFSVVTKSDLAGQNPTGSQDAFTYVIYATTVIVAFVGVLVWRYLKMDNVNEEDILIEKISMSKIKEVLSLPSVWLLMIIIMSAYVGYKITDVFSLYANEIMLYDEVESAQVGTFLLYIRPIVGLVIGIIADRSKITLFLLLSFIFSFLGALLFALGWVGSSSALFFLLSTLLVAAGIYGARSLYFAILKIGKIPVVLTGTAVGLISIIGYTPDIFAGPLMGWLLDKSPGIVGHRNVFWMLASFSFIGIIASGIYYKMYGVKGELRRA